MSDSSWYDPRKLQAAIAAQGAGGDGRTVLSGQYLQSILNPLSGGAISGAGQMPASQVVNGADSYQTQDSYYNPGAYTLPNGQTIQLGSTPNSDAPHYADKAAYDAEVAKNGGVFGSVGFQNPTGGSGDWARAMYKIDPATGAATPAYAQNNYAPAGAWAGGMRDWVKDMAVAAASIYGANAMAGGSGASAAGTGSSGAAATAGAGASTGSTGALGYGVGYVAPSAGQFAGMTTAQLDAAAAGMGGAAGGAAGGASAAYPETAAHAQLAGINAPAVSSTSSPLASLGGKLGDMSAGQYLKAAQAVAPLLGSAGGGGSSGGTPGSGSAYPASAPTAMGPAAQYAYNGFTADTTGRPAPSAAVNLNDPSAAMFGYGANPTYYKRPGMADGGVVSPEDAPYSTDGSAYGLYNDAVNTAYPDTASHAQLAGINAPYQSEPSPVAAPTRGALGGLSDWWDALGNGEDKVAQRNAQNKLQLGLGGLGLIMSLLNKRNAAPGYQTPAQLRAGLPGGNGAAMTPQMIAAMSTYFNSPGSTFVPGPAHNPFIAPAGVVTTGGPHMASGGGVHHSDAPAYSPAFHGPYVRGPGSGQADQVDAALSPGEYVMDADTVSSLGDGSNEHGARVLDGMREAIRAHKRAASASEIPPPALSPLQYMKMARSK